MMQFDLNPGLLLLLGAASVLVCTGTLRLPIMLGATIGAMALALTHDFGSYARFTQIGLEITRLQLDPLSQVFGLGLGLGAILLVIASAGGRDRYRDGALLAAFGGASGAVYAGDLISFTAYLETASLAVVALVFVGGEALARRASIQVLAWQACSGACLATGAGLIWGSTASNAIGPMQIDGPGPVIFLIGVLVKMGAVPAHGWLRACALATKGISLGAILASLPIVGLYALARCFGDTRVLLPLGALICVYPAVLACIATEYRARLVFALASWIGLAMIGIMGGGPLGLAGACALAFTLCILSPLLFLGPRAQNLAGSRQDWAVRGLGLLGAACLLSVPGTLGYAASSLLLDGLARDGQAGMWLIGMFGAIAPLLALFAAPSGALPPRQENEPSQSVDFSCMLAMGCSAFFILVIGVDSRWLYALLPPGQLLYTPYDGAHLIAKGQLLCASGLLFALWGQLRATRLGAMLSVPARSSRDLMDWAVLFSHAALRQLEAGAAWRARTRASFQAYASARAKAGQNWLKASETGVFRDILGPGLVLAIAASLALGLLFNAG